MSPLCPSILLLQKGDTFSSFWELPQHLPPAGSSEGQLGQRGGPKSGDREPPSASTGRYSFQSTQDTFEKWERRLGTQVPNQGMWGLGWGSQNPWRMLGALLETPTSMSEPALW